MPSARCGRASRILEAIAELNEADPDLDLQVRVGINTGEAVVALGARPEQGEGIVTGDVVNTAARIQSAAPVNGVAVGEQTYRATSHVFEYEPLEPVSVKGKTEPLVALAGEGDPRPLRSRHHPRVQDAVRRPRAREAASDRDLRARGAAALGAAGDDRRRARSRQEPARRRALRLHRRRSRSSSAGGRAAACPTAKGSRSGRSGRSSRPRQASSSPTPPKWPRRSWTRRVAPEEPERQWLLQRLAPLVGRRGGVAGRAAGAVHGLAPLPRESRRRAPDRPRLRGPALGGRGAARLPRAPGRVVTGRTAASRLRGPARAIRAPAGLGRRAAQRAHDQPLAALGSGDGGARLAPRHARPSSARSSQRAILERAGGNPLYAEEFVRLLADRGLERQEMPWRRRRCPRACRR